jgi:hypothetical protein
MLFDLFIQLQRAPLHEQQRTIRRLRESLSAGQTMKDANSATSEVSRDLALSFLLSLDEKQPFWLNLDGLTLVRPPGADHEHHFLELTV